MEFKINTIDGIEVFGGVITAELACNCNSNGLYSELCKRASLYSKFNVSGMEELLNKTDIGLQAFAEISEYNATVKLDVYQSDCDTTEIIIPITDEEKQGLFSERECYLYRNTICSLANDIEGYMYDCGEYSKPPLQRIKWIDTENRQVAWCNILHSLTDDIDSVMDYLNHKYHATADEYKRRAKYLLNKINESLEIIETEEE